MQRFTSCVLLMGGVFLVSRAGSSADKQFNGTTTESWHWTCNASSILPATLDESDLMLSILLSALNQTLDPDLEWLVKLTESELITNPTLSKLKTITYFPRGQLKPLASAFLQLNTVGHALGSSKAPLIDSDESMLRNWKYMCEYTKKHGLTVMNNTPPDFTVTVVTKLVCCAGDACEAQRDGDTTTKDSFLRIAIVAAQEDIASGKAICEVRQSLIKNDTLIDGSVVFFKGGITQSGALLECHVPRELGCDFKCLMINESGEKYELSLKHSFEDREYCKTADAGDKNSTTNLSPEAVAGIVIAIMVVLSIIVAIVVVYWVCRRRNRRPTTTNGPQQTDAGSPLNCDGDNE